MAQNKVVKRGAVLFLETSGNKSLLLKRANNYGMMLKSDSTHNSVVGVECPPESKQTSKIPNSLVSH